MRILSSPAFRSVETNPFTGLLYNALTDADATIVVEDFSVRSLAFRDWDIWHLHWPERTPHHPNGAVAWAKTTGLAIALLFARLRGTRIVWTVHNVAANEQRRPWAEQLFMRWFVRHVNGVISLSQEALEVAYCHYPGLAESLVAVIPHGHYIGVYRTAADRTDARLSLGLDPEKSVVAFVGRIARYKNVGALVDAFRGLADPDAQLLIAGAPSNTRLQVALAGAAGGDPRIKLHFSRLDDEGLARALCAADVVVLPYERPLNSGAALLALSMNRPILVPAFGSLIALAETVGDGWVQTYEGGLTSEHLAHALEAIPARSEQINSVLEAHFGWQLIGRQTTDFYAEVARTAA